VKKINRQNRSMIKKKGIKMSRAVLPIILISVLLLCACSRDTLPPGAVALVNGRPISLRLVEARHDSGEASFAISKNPSVELLREQYGRILAELIIQELACQELEGIGLSVDEQDVQAAEGEIRANYPEGSFEEALLEDNIDIQTWRELLRYGLAMQRLEQQVLRPKINVSIEEVDAYYKERAPEFMVPEHAVLVVISAPVQMQALDVCRNLPDESFLPAGVLMQSVSIRPAQIPEIWQKDIERLELGSHTQERFVDGMYQCIVRKAHEQMRQLSIMEAYPQIEQAIVERKMEPLFADWLGVVASEAKIYVSSQLLPLGTAQAR
jgi:hypothetical protein